MGNCKSTILKKFWKSTNCLGKSRAATRLLADWSCSRSAASRLPATHLNCRDTSSRSWIWTVSGWTKSSYRKQPNLPPELKTSQIEKMLHSHRATQTVGRRDRESSFNNSLRLISGYNNVYESNMVRRNARRK